MFSYGCTFEERRERGILTAALACNQNVAKVTTRSVCTSWGSARIPIARFPPVRGLEFIPSSNLMDCNELLEDSLCLVCCWSARVQRYRSLYLRKYRAIWWESIQPHVLPQLRFLGTQLPGLTHIIHIRVISLITRPYVGILDHRRLPGRTARYLVGSGYVGAQ